MFTTLFIILAVLVIGVILLHLVDAIVVEHHTISVLDLPNIAETEPVSEPVCGAETAPRAHHTGGVR